MPNRIIRESCRTSLSLSKVSHGAERLFWRLLTCADDYGRIEADPQLIQAACFPRQLLIVHVADVRTFLDELVGQDMLVPYTVLGRDYAYFRNWTKHNKKRSQYSKFPCPDASFCKQTRACASRCVHLSADADICNTNRDSRVETRDTRVESREGLAYANGNEMADLERGRAFLRAAGLNPPTA